MRPQLMVASCLLLLLAQWGSSFDHSSSCQLQNYIVSHLGNDSNECLHKDSKIPCHTLNYLLPFINDKNCVNITILDDQYLSIGLVKLQFVQNWTIVGSNSKSATINIHCSNESGISFENFSSIHLRHLQFVNCTTFNNYTSDDDSDFALLEYSALYFFQGSDVVITGCLFCNGSGTAVIMNDVAGENLIKDTQFVRNRALETQENASSMNSTSGGLIVRSSSTFEPVSYTIEGCNFVENENNKCHDYMIGLGGGATFNIIVSTNITIVDSNFTSNKACQGGGINVYYVGQEYNYSDVRVEVVNSIFAHNRAIHEGGGMCVQLGEYSLSLSLTLQNTKFFNNSGMSGGGISVFAKTFLSSTNFTAVNSMWSGNNALTSGFAVGLFAKSDRPDNDPDLVINGSFIGCKFHFNGYYNSLGAVGAVMVDGARADFTNASFYRNNGTALYICYHAYASISGSFINNRGTNGGAVHVDDSSMLGLREGVTVFKDNHAVMDGGAIFVEYMEYETECVFESLEELLNVSKLFNVSFFNNTAGNLFQSIFIGNANGCIEKKPVSMEDIILFDARIFKYYPCEKTQVASFAENVQVDYFPKVKDVIKVMPGENFYLNLTVKDAFDNNAHQSGNLRLQVQVKQLISGVRFVGPQYLGFDDSTVNNALAIKANQSLIGYDGLSLELLYTIHSSNHETSISIQVNLTECKLGFVFKDQICHCSNKSDVKNLVCNKMNACVRYGYWYSNDSDTMGMTIPCPGQNCDYLSGHCPNNSTCPDTPDFCQLTANNSLCKNGRGGFLCSECLDDYAYTFAGLKCVQNSTCSVQNTAYFIVGLIAYWICLVVFVLFFLSIDMSMGSGMAYGIMYYFSVVEIFTDNTVTESILQTIISTSVAVTQLCPQAFGDILICFVEDWRLNLHHQLFHYVTPAAVIFLILAVILWSRFCPCPKKISPAENTPIHAMCLLILASYTSVTFTSFEILKPLRIGTNDLRVYVDPHLKYMHKEHLPYAIVALFFELISLPICFLILFAPCLSRKVNIVKLRLKPILDEFQACYRPECRWFAGFYFLARQVIFLVNIIPTGLLPESNTYLHAINTVILTIHCSFQPYKRKWLNVLDTLLLVDILFLSFFQLEYDTNFVHRATAYVLIILPSLYLAAIVLLAILYRLSCCCKHLVCVQRFKFNHGNKLSSTEVTPTHNSVAINASEFQDSGDDGEREPLLADSVHSGQIPYPHNRNSGGARPFTTASVRVSRINRLHSQAT